jgi:hypothetical protein
MKKDIWILTALGVIVLHSPVRAKGVVDDTSDQTAPAIAAPSAASSPRQSVNRPVPDNADHGLNVAGGQTLNLGFGGVGVRPSLEWMF